MRNDTMRAALQMVRLLTALLLLSLATGCAEKVAPGQQKPLGRDYQPPPIDGFPSDAPPSRI